MALRRRSNATNISSPLWVTGARRTIALSRSSSPGFRALARREPDRARPPERRSSRGTQSRATLDRECSLARRVPPDSPRKPARRPAPCCAPARDARRHRDPSKSAGRATTTFNARLEGGVGILKRALLKLCDLAPHVGAVFRVRPHFRPQARSTRPRDPPRAFRACSTPRRPSSALASSLRHGGLEHVERFAR